MPRRFAASAQGCDWGKIVVLEDEAEPVTGHIYLAKG
jgi:hypothetical protein